MTLAVHKLCDSLGYSFNQPELLQRALSHRSVGSDNNERLEFLGDSILSYVISVELFKRFPKIDEGGLSRLRASLVKGDTLAVVARELSLGDYLRLGPGELKSGGFRRSSILADALEALLGAIYIDSDIETVQGVILHLFNERLTAVNPDTSLKDPKTRLQEYLQSRQLALPSYEVINITGKAHAQTFSVSCRIEGLDKEVVADGSSRRKAEQTAAQLILEKLDSE
ncbi:MAG: ribonuclease III [Kangiella sp.]|nr:ribonuclease III [Kangiella sp.]